MAQCLQTTYPDPLIKLLSLDPLSFLISLHSLGQVRFGRISVIITTLPVSQNINSLHNVVS